MTNETDVSAGPPALTAIRRRRRRRAAFVVAWLAFFMWPMALEELAPLRLDTVRLTGIGGAPNLTLDGARGGGRVGAAPTFVTAQATTPLQGFRLLDSLPPGLLTTLQTIPPAEPAVSADLPQFGSPASAVSSFNPPSLPPSPGSNPGSPFVTPPGGPGPSPPPVISPPLPVDPTVTPPVTPPDNPVRPPPDPFVPPTIVAPPGNPPVVTPIVNPFVAPPPDPGGPGGSSCPGSPGCPGDPEKPVLPDPGPGGGGGTQGGGPAGIPEPSVWLELVLGAGLAGAGLRRARREGQPATALRARSNA